MQNYFEPTPLRNQTQVCSFSNDTKNSKQIIRGIKVKTSWKLKTYKTKVQFFS